MLSVFRVLTLTMDFRSEQVPNPSQVRGPVISKPLDFAQALCPLQLADLACRIANK